MKLAIYAITVNGAKQGEWLKKALPFADLYISEALAIENSQALPLTLPLSQFVSEKFAQYDGHIFICATGIVMRVISPMIKDKREDPAVVCLDEQALFAISLLSGHRGGANELTQRVAHIVKATPVITTASEVSQSVSVDMLGAPFGWLLDPISEPSITAVSAAVVNHQPIIIAQEAGEKNWWQYDKRMPFNIICHTSLADVKSSEYHGVVLISDKRALQVSGWENKLVLWRPQSLVLGIGCDRNTPLAVLNAGLEAFSETFNLSLESVYGFASIDLKADEAGLLALSQQKQWPFITYQAALLDGIDGIESPSEYVKKVTGSNSVAEAAALKHSGRDSLLVPKWKFKQDGYNMTIACCRRAFSESLVRHKRKNWFADKKHGGEMRHGKDESLAESKTEVIKVNAYGNEVVAGYQCKPKHVDLDRPMLHHSHHILLCEGKRCAQAGSKNLAHDLRSLLKEVGLSSGEHRIKISRTMCAGACRNRATLVIYQRNRNKIEPLNNGRWLKNIEQFSEEQWRTLFAALAENRDLSQVLEDKFFVVIESPEKESHCG